MRTAGSGPESPSTAIIATLPVNASNHPGNLGLGKPKQEPGSMRQEAAAVEQGAGSDESGTGGGEPGAGRDVSSERSGTLWDIIKDSTLSEKTRGYLPTIRKALVTGAGALALAAYATAAKVETVEPKLALPATAQWAFDEYLDDYRDFKAFAVGRGGRTWHRSWNFGTAQEAIEFALSGCRKRADDCKIYAVGNTMVGDMSPEEIENAIDVYETTHSKGSLKATGLWPDYPLEVSCPIITSSFADTTDLFRDERSKPHSGVDITVEEGTEILAAASGQVVAKYKTANGSWVLSIQHYPFDTGLRDYTYSSYAHIQKKTPVEVGQVVKRGQVIAYSGETGTFYPHLHLKTLRSPDPDFELKKGGRPFVVTNGYVMDPVLFMSGTLVIHRIPNKRVEIHYQSEDSDARVRWPLRCKGELRLLELRLLALALPGSNKFDGAWEGSLRCGDCENCAGPLKKSVKINIEKGKFDIIPDSTYMGNGAVDEQGNVSIDWNSNSPDWNRQSRRNFRFVGKYEEGIFRLKGERGPRKCTIQLSRATSPVGASN